jgi:hypothetical protein
MAQIGIKIGDAFQNTEGYRQNLGMIATSVLNENLGQPEPPLEPDIANPQTEDLVQ